MPIKILSVQKGSLAAQAGIQPGETLLRINHESVLDEIDYQALIAQRRLTLDISNAEGCEREIRIRKPEYAPLGLQLDERTILEPRLCHNHCIFCFVDQMPPDMRKTLYVKDDDWRLSLMMGNFVTLTNVDDAEFDRLLRRKASPLYISVHATDPEVRVKMLRNPSAGNLMDRLKKLRDAGLKFHCQVVLCPGINDGPVLHQTIVDLAALYPAAQSLAIVPIGLTAHRRGLPPLRLITPVEAKSLLYDIDLIQSYYLRALGTRFVFAADELYCLANRPIPSEESYEGYAQIENGIGMIRKLADECEEYYSSAHEDFCQTSHSQSLLIATGVSAAPHIQTLANKYAPPDTSIQVITVPNHFFGPSVTVAGLIVGRDLVSAVKGKKADKLLISKCMLRDNTDQFLDDMTVGDVAAAAGLPIRPVANTGEDFILALYGK